MAVFTYNVRNLDAAVRRLLDRHRDVRHTAMLQVADFLRGEAQRRCPFDAGNLAGDIRGDTEINQKSETVCLYVPVNAPSAKYAIPMHEHFYNLGENSKAKQGEVDVTVGREYLTRAITENMDEIRRRIMFTLHRETERNA